MEAQKRQRLNNTDPSLTTGSLALSTITNMTGTQDSTNNDKWGVKNWGDRYFSINEAGNISVEPTGRGGDAPKIDLFNLVQDCVKRGHSPPLLIRFSNIIDDKIKTLNNAFEKYCDNYQQVFPLRVAVSRTILEQVVKNVDVGLCASSKPELLIVLAMLPSRGRTIVCTGFKDLEYVETSLLAQQLGQVPIIVIEKLEELDLVLKASQKLGIKPILGVRAKIVSVQLKDASDEVSLPNSHRSLGFSVDVGDNAKFGLSATEMMTVVGRLKDKGLLDCLQMAHFHIGSQISNIAAIRQATKEAIQYYIQLYRLGCNMKYLDVGGGLAVDYDGSHTNNPMSMNYSVDEYASEITSVIKTSLGTQKIPYPTIISESGRNIVSHHSVVIFNITDATTVHPLKQNLASGNLFGASIEPPIQHDHELCHKMYELLRNIEPSNLQESIHDAKQYKDEALALFTLGMMDLTMRSKLETLFWCCIADVQTFLKLGKFVPEELEDLRSLLSFTYYANFSVFQSSPDSWARGFVFPVAPIHRLNESPEIVATIADLTCDSDGKLSCFSSTERRDGSTKDLMALHELNPNEPYYVATFLTGNQDNHLGSLHNLYGDTHVLLVHSDPDHPLGYNLKHTLPGNTIDDVLKSFQYDTRAMLESVRLQSEAALKTGQLSLNHCKLILSHFSRSLRNYTYLSSDGDLDGLPPGFDSILNMEDGEASRNASFNDNRRYIFTFNDSDIPLEFKDGSLGGPPVTVRSPKPPTSPNQLQ